MSSIFKAGLAAACAAALMCAPAISRAAYASPFDLAAADAPASSMLDAVASAMSPSTGVRSAPVIVAEGMQSALSAKALRNPTFGNLRGNADLLLWNLCAVVRAHQGRRSFDLIDAGIATVHISEDISNVSAVPLPGVVWLFVMGVMGLAGMRVTGIKGVKATRAADTGHKWPQYGSPVAA